MSTSDQNANETRDRSAAAMPDRDRQKRTRIAVLAGVALLAFAGTAMASRVHDPLGGDRPEARAITYLPRAQVAFESFYAKKRRSPSPAELATAIAKGGGPKVVVVGPGKKKPNALRIAGTKQAPTLELLNERGNVALYGDMPVVIQVNLP